MAILTKVRTDPDHARYNYISTRYDCHLARIPPCVASESLTSDKTATLHN